MINDFAVFILTHGRPNNQHTLQALKKAGYTGKIYLVVDDLDKTIDEYKKMYGESVIVFDKMKYVAIHETGVLKPHINFASFARNAIEDMAKDMELSYFAMVDDDLTKFRFRYEEDNKLKSLNVKDMDRVLMHYIDFMEQGNIPTLSLASQFRFIGGINNIAPINSSKWRLALTFYIRSTKTKVVWKSNICEDRITCMLSNREGFVWLQLPFVQLDTKEMHGINDGGNSDTYREITDFYRIFFTEVFVPDCNIAMYWSRNNGWVNKVPDWNTLCPMIISDKYKHSQ